MASIRGAKGKGDTQSAVRVGTARSGGLRKVGRPAGYGGRIATSARGGLADQALGANNRGSGGKAAPGTGLPARGPAGGASADSGIVESTTPAGGTTPTEPRPTSGTGTAPAPATTHETLDSTFAKAAPLSSIRASSGTTATRPTSTATKPASSGTTAKRTTTSNVVKTAVGAAALIGAALAAGTKVTTKPTSPAAIRAAADKRRAANLKQAQRDLSKGTSAHLGR